MSRKILLIDESDLKMDTAIEQNVDSKLLKTTLNNVQEINLQPILTKSLYDAVVESAYLFIASGQTMSDLHKELLEDYIQPYLKAATVAEYIMVNNYKLTNKGSLKIRDDGAEVLNNQEIEKVKLHYEQHAAFYKNQLIDYLCEKELLTRESDTDVSSDTIGWYLE